MRAHSSPRSRNVFARSKPILSLAIALSLFACRRNEVALFDVSDATFDDFFLVSVDANGAPIRTSGIFGVRDGAIVFGGRPVIELGPNESSAIMIGLTHAELSAIHPGFDAGREMEIAVALGMPPPSPELRFQGAMALVDTALPEDAIARRPGTKDNFLPVQVATDIVLTIPVDPEYCRTGHDGALHAFGRTPVLLPITRAIPGDTDNTTGSGYRQAKAVRYVDRDRVLVLASQLMYLVARGGDVILPDTFGGYQPRTPSPALAFDAIGDADRQAESFAFDAPSRGGSARRVLVAGSKKDRGTIFEIDLDDRGLRFVADATVAHSIAVTDYRDVAVDAAGNAIAVGDPGVVVVRTATSSTFVTVGGIDPGGDVSFMHVIATNDPARPHLISDNRGRFFLGNALTGAWDVYRRPLVMGVRNYALAALPDGSELWAAEPEGVVLRKIGSEPWSSIHPIVPPRYAPCVSAQSGDDPYLLDQSVKGIRVHGDAAFVTIDACTSLLRIERSSLCTSVITPPDGMIGTTDTNPIAIDLMDTLLITGGRAGILLELDTSP